MLNPDTEPKGGVVAKLNQTFVKQVKSPRAGYEVYWDDELKDFGLRVTSAGVKSFVLPPYEREENPACSFERAGTGVAEVIAARWRLLVPW
jgi:hypothetical protein